MVLVVVVVAAIGHRGVDGVSRRGPPLLRDGVDNLAISVWWLLIVLRLLLQSGRGNGSEEGEEEDVAYSQAAMGAW